MSERSSENSLFKYEARGPRSGRTAALAALYVIEFLVGAEVGVFQIALRRIGLEFGLDDAGMGMLVSLQFVAILISPLLFGHLADKKGKRPVLLIFGAVFFAGTCAILFAAGQVLIGIGIFLVGMGYSISEAVGTAAMADIDPENTVRHINLSQAAYCVGAVVSPLISAKLLDEAGWNWRWLFLCVGIAFASGAAFFYTAGKPVTASGKSWEKGPDEKAGKLTLRALLPVALLAVILFIYIGCENGIVFFSDSFFAEDLAAENVAALSVSFFWLAMIPARILAAVFQKRSGLMLIIAFAAGAILLFIMSRVNSSAAGLVLSFLLGFFCGSVWPSAMSRGIALFPQNSATVTSVLEAACALGGIAFPTVYGYISAASGRRAGYLFLGAAMAAALAAAIFTVCGRRDAGS